MNEAEQILVAALRSGKYRQGKTKLEYRDCGIVYNCCLGVACREYQKIKGDLVIEKDSINKETIFDSCRGYLPYKVKKWLGWDGDRGYTDSANLTKSLASFNDEGKTFEQIADIIERGEVMHLQG